jgi:hypothetical protein
MFQFPRFPHPSLCVQLGVSANYGGWIAPFGNPRLSLIDSKPRLFAVFPRPSSALDAKASTMRPYSLDLH